MPRYFQYITLMVAFAITAVPGPLLQGAENNDAIVEQLSRMEQLQLEQLQSMDQALLAEISRRTGAKRLRERTESLMALSIPTIGKRETDEAGRARIHTYLEEVISGLEPLGLERIGTFREKVAAPVDLHDLEDEDEREEPARLTLEGEAFELFPLWPNGPMPSLVPEEGLTGPLVHVGDGSWNKLKGRELDGAIALLDFKGARNIERLFSLGVLAVIVAEDEHVHYENAASLTTKTPYPFPRFYVEEETREAILERLASRSGELQVTLDGGQVYEERTVESFFVRLPAPETTPFTLDDERVLEWVAALHGIGTTAIREANAGRDDLTSPGTVINVPGEEAGHTIPVDGLWDVAASMNDVSSQELKEANPSLAGEALATGTPIMVPSGRLPLVLLAPLDTASVVPGAPHGARIMANLAATIEYMEFLVRGEGLRLRRDVIFGFLDGDTLGGQASRLVAEYAFLQKDSFSSGLGAVAGRREMIERYRAGAEWFSSGDMPDSAEIRRWLVDDWLLPRFEERRIALAEDRIRVIMEARGSEALPPLEVLERRLAEVASLRDQTLMSGGTEEDRLRALRQAWEIEEDRFAAYGLGPDTLGDRFARERRTEERTLANHLHNLESGQRLRDRVVKIRGDTRRLALGWKLAFGDGSPHLGIGLTGDLSKTMRKAGTTGSEVSSLRTRFRKIAAFGASRAGWAEDFTFIGSEDTSKLALQPTPFIPLYQDLWYSSNIHVLPLGSEGDRMERVDTPHDTVERLNWENFSLQARTALSVLTASLESLLDSRYSGNKRERELSRITGKTVQFNIRSGIDAQDPVPETYVYLPQLGRSPFTDSNTEMLYGYRRGVLRKSLLNGSFEMPVEIASYNPQPRINAYTLDRGDALFRKVATEGQVGTKPQDTTFSYRAGEAVLKNLVMIDVYPRVIFPGVNPATYNSVLGNAYNKLQVELVDAVINGPPRDYAVDNPLLDFSENQSDGIILYLQKGDRVRVMIRQGMDYFMVLPGPVVVEEDGKARGRGITIGPDGEDRSLYLALTPYEIARGMWELASHRLGLYESFGIYSRVLREAIDRSREKLDHAEAAIEEANWQEAIGNSREAWGMLVKNFPRILKLGREAVFSVILLMALAVPASAFLERLVIGSKSIIARLTGTSAIFIAATLFLNAFHPAFKISLSPFIIVIAFTMILMSLIVLVLSYSRFDVVLRRFRSAGGQVESEEISLMSSLSTAFSLGVSNLKKRSFRTALTVFTVTALTFSIVGFVAVQGSDALTRNSIPLNDRIEGEDVDPIPPPYDGFLIRSPNWLKVSQSQVSAIESEFGATAEVTVRAHYIETEGGNNANREGVNQVPLTRGEQRHIVTGIMAFQPNETEFTGINEAVSGREWFRETDTGAGELGDRRVIILPDSAAAGLGITPDMILDESGNRRPVEDLPVIRMSNQEWRVIGILDTDHANRIRDVNGQSLAMVDYLASGMSSGVSGSSRIISEGQSFHFDWSRLVIVPFMARQDVGAELRSVAVKLPETLDSETLFADLTKRLKNEFFVASDGEVSLVVPRQQVNFAGIAKILLPVLLCILIVMNTMLGTVEERKGEVGMLGAIGLSPRQIAFLMFAESTVFSILGIIFGTFGGLLFANIVNAVNAAGGNFLTSLSFNFTSLISMSLATGTGLIVLLATLIPANKAAALAAPSGMTEWELPEAEMAGEIRFKLPFTLTRGNAVGMVAFFRQFLINHNEPTSEDFNCREVLVRLSESEGKPVISLSTDMWLAPYDLDVAQHFALNLEPGTRESVYEVELVMNRFSGSEENSRRTAYNYLNLVRRQFLLWRNLEPERRTDFIREGAELLKRSASTPVSHE